MPQIIIKRFEKADESRKFAARGQLELVKFKDALVGKAVFEPGWRWSKDVSPIAGTPSCQAEHTCFVLSGRLHMVMDNGEEAEMGPGDMVYIPPGHDAWTVGSEPCVALDFTGAATYAQPGISGRAGKPVGTEQRPRH